MNSAHNNSSPVMQAVKSVENHLFQQGSKLPQETQNAMMSIAPPDSKNQMGLARKSVQEISCFASCEPG